MSVAAPDYLPPNNLDAEASVLASVLLDRDAIAFLGPQVTPDDFYSTANGAIWRAMLSLWTRREPCDLITVQAELARMGTLDRIGGAPYLASLFTVIPTSVHGDYYAGIVSRLATKRRLIAAASKIVSLAWQPETNPDELLVEARRMLADAAPQADQRSIRSFEELADWLAEEMDGRMDPAYQADVVPTGLYDLDKAIRGGGMQRGELVILGARPGAGKTAFMLQTVKNFARHQIATNPDPQYTLIISAEMTAEALTWRALTETTHLTTGQLQDPRSLTELDLDRVARELQALRTLPVLIDDRAAPTTEQMRLTVERLQARYPIRYVVFDYLGLAGDKHADETHRYSKIADGLKTLAKACDVSVLALAQLNRNVESRGKGKMRPTLADLRQSGQIEANADMVWGLYRHDYYVQTGQEDPDDTLHNVAELNILKQRDGGTSVVHLQFTPETTSFHSLDRRHE